MKTIVISGTVLIMFAATALAGSARTPEPASFLMLGTGLIGLGILAARFRKK